jgi:hypothetical protein
MCKILTKLELQSQTSAHLEQNRPVLKTNHLPTKDKTKMNKIKLHIAHGTGTSTKVGLSKGTSNS